MMMQQTAATSSSFIPSTPPNIDNDVKPIRSAQTLAFLDLETTGLLQFGKPPPRITEIALVALDRDEFIRSIRDVNQRNGDPAGPSFITPRIVNKLLQAINPEVDIHHIASQVSGLQLENLSRMPTFAQFAPAFWPFLTQLPKPVCLIAHNGNKFDFPILKSELIRANLVFGNGTTTADNEEILCVDSMDLFQRIDNRWIREYNKSNSNNDPTVLQDEPPTTTNGTTSSAPAETGGPAAVSPVIYRYRFTSINGTPGTEYETSPSRSSPASASSIAEVRSSPADIAGAAENGVRRQLFPAGSGSGSVESTPAAAKEKILAVHNSNGVTPGSGAAPRLSYSLKMVHQRVFDGADPLNHHSAEADCLSVMQIAAQYGEEFLREMDATMKSVREIRAPQ